MQRFLLRVLVAAAPFVVGCASIEGVMSGSIAEGIPKMRDRLPHTVKVHFANPVNARGYPLHERNRKQVQDAFGKAFDALGVSHSTETNGCSHILNVVVENWEYGDAGFLGKGDRDEVSMAVMLQNADTDRVLTRASLYARNLDLLVLKYVKTLFVDEK